MVVGAARCDVKLLIKRMKRWPFILFGISLASWDFDDCFELERENGVCHKLMVN